MWYKLHRNLKPNCAFNKYCASINQQFVCSYATPGETTAHSYQESQLKMLSDVLYYKTKELSHVLCCVLLIIIVLPLFSTVVPSNIFMFQSCRPFDVITFSTGYVDVEVTSEAPSSHPIYLCFCPVGLSLL